MVRIAMTVAVKGRALGQLREVIEEEKLDTDQPTISFRASVGKINPDLTIGPDASSAKELLANRGMANNGMLLAGRGFVLDESEAKHLGLGVPGISEVIRPYLNGRDLMIARRVPRYVIDLFNFDADVTRKEFPAIYQHLLSTVKPERDKNNRASYRNRWWQFAEPRRDFRPALKGLRRYIATTETTKHRIFQFLDIGIVPDHMIIGFAFDDAYTLGVLSSYIHTLWALRAGGWLGIGNDPRYSKSRVFDPFPFPSPGELLRAKIRGAAEEIDSLRKRQLNKHPALTLTQTYNVLEKLKANAPLDEDDEGIKASGLVVILKELHEKLDRLAFEAYGWPQMLSNDEILEKLVALNNERAEEEKRGHVRWLRPDYQIPRFGKDIDKMAAKEEGAQIAADLGLPEPSARKPSFPADAVAQTAAVFSLLASARGPVDAASIAGNFRKTRNLEATITNVLESLLRLGHVSSKDGKTFEIRRVA